MTVVLMIPDEVGHDAGKEPNVVFALAEPDHMHLVLRVNFLDFGLVHARMRNDDDGHIRKLASDCFGDIRSRLEVDVFPHDDDQIELVSPGFTQDHPTEGQTTA